MMLSLNPLHQGRTNHDAEILVGWLEILDRTRRGKDTRAGIAGHTEQRRMVMRDPAVR